MTRSELSYEVTAKARRSYAEDIFDIAAVAAAILDRAEEGYRSYRITQDYPFDLAESAAARQLQEWLDQENFRYAWRPTAEVIDPFRPVSSAEYPELVIFW